MCHYNCVRGNIRTHNTPNTKYYLSINSPALSVLVYLYNTLRRHVIRRCAEGFTARHHAARLVFLLFNLLLCVILLRKQYWPNRRGGNNILKSKIAKCQRMSSPDAFRAIKRWIMPQVKGVPLVCISALVPCRQLKAYLQHPYPARKGNRWR